MERNRKTLTGIVVSNKMNKTIVVQVETKSKHKLYHKLVITHKKYHAHDEKEECNVGDRVKIVETRPISKTKSWKLDTILERSK